MNEDEDEAIRRKLINAFRPDAAGPLSEKLRAVWDAAVEYERNRLTIAPPVPQGRHGTEYAYVICRCRCDECMAHMRPLWRERRLRRTNK